MKKGQVYQGVAGEIRFPNRTVVTTDEGEECIVPNALPGQRVEFRVERVRGTRREGRLLSVVQKSEIETVKEVCPHFGRCGGCLYQSVPYIQQLRIKEYQVRRLLNEVCEDYIGPSSMGLLLFKDYTNGIDDEMTISASYMRGCAANFKKFVEEGVLSAYWQTLKPYFKETDIDENFLSSHNALIGAYSDDIVKTVNIVGMFKEIGEDGEPVFEIDKPRTVATLKNYR